MCITVQLSMCSALSAATSIRYHSRFCLSSTFLIFFKSFLCAALRVAVFAVQMVYYHASEDFASPFFIFLKKIQHPVKSTSDRPNEQAAKAAANQGC